MATVKEITHDSSTTLSDFYNTISDVDGAVTVTVGAALNSSTNGVNVSYDAGSNNASFQQTFTAISTGEFRMRAYLDTTNLSTLTFGSYFSLSILNSNTDVFIQIIMRDDPTIAQFWYFTDTSGLVQLGGDFSFSVGVHCVEARCVRESVDTAGDGEVEFFIDGVSQGSSTTVDNFVAWDANKPDRVKSEVLLTSTVVGTLFYDEFIIDGDDQADLGCSAGSHIWLSTDGAVTFTDIGDSAWAANVVGGVVVVPGTAYQTIFAAVGTDLYKTTNGGTAWSLETAIGYEVDSIELEKGNETVILKKRDTAGAVRSQLWDGVALSNISTGNFATGGTTKVENVV